MRLKSRPLCRGWRLGVLTEMRAFLGLVGFLRKYVQGLSDLAQPLTELFERGEAVELGGSGAKGV